MARCLCTQEVDLKELMAFVACRLIPLDKKPGVRPIGIGDVSRRIIAKAVLFSVLFILTFSWLPVHYRLVLAMMLEQKLPSMP